MNDKLAEWPYLSVPDYPKDDVAATIRHSILNNQPVVIRAVDAVEAARADLGFGALGVIDNQAMSIEPEQVRCQYLGSRINHRTIGRRSGYHRGQYGQCTILLATGTRSIRDRSL